LINCSVLKVSKNFKPEAVEASRNGNFEWKSK